GAVLYELLQGRVLSQELFTPPPIIDTPTGEPVPGPLAELVQQCLEMDPSRRPETTLEVGKRLTTAMPKKAAPDTARAMVEAGLARAPAKSRAPVFAALAALVLVGGGTAFVLVPPAA